MKKKLVKRKLAKMKISLLVLCIAGSLILIFYACKRESISEIKTEIDVGESSQVIRTRSGELSWDYPVKPGMEKWKLFQSNEEMVRACQIPESILSSLSTEELTDLCLKYPLLNDVFAFNSYNDGLDKLFSDFNGMRELYKREDVSSSLTRRYIDKVESFSFLDGTAPEIEKGFFIISVSALEVLLSRVEIQNEQKEILQSLVTGYEGKLKYLDYFRGFGFRSNLYSRGHVILKIDRSGIDAANSVLFSGRADDESINIIDKLSYQLKN